MRRARAREECRAHLHAPSRRARHDGADRGVRDGREHAVRGIRECEPDRSAGNHALAIERLGDERDRLAEADRERGIHEPDPGRVRANANVRQYRLSDPDVK